MIHNTKNDLPSDIRKKVNVILEQLLADGIDMYYQAKQAHWNVKGENFIALHELFDSLATEVNSVVDSIAERIKQLGGSAQGTVRVAAQKSRLKEYPLEAVESQEHVDALSTVLSVFNSHLRKAIDDSDAMGDAVTADMFTSITRGLDKQLWFVESHLKGK